MLGVEPVQRLGAAALYVFEHRHVRLTHFRRTAAAREQHDARVRRRGRELGRGKGVKLPVRGDHIKPVLLDAQRAAFIELAHGGQELYIFSFLCGKKGVNILADALTAAREEGGEHGAVAVVGLQCEQPREKLRAASGGQLVLRGDVSRGEPVEKRRGALGFIVRAEEADLFEKLRIGVKAVARRKTQRHGLHHGGAAVKIYVRDFLRAPGRGKVHAEVLAHAVRPERFRQRRPAAEKNALGMDHNAGAIPREGGDDLHRDRHETKNALRDAYAHLSAGQADAEIEIAEPLAHLPPETGQNAALVGKNVKIVFIQPDNGAAVVGKGELAELFAARRGEDRVHIVPKGGGTAVADEKRREQQQKKDPCRYRDRPCAGAALCRFLLHAILPPFRRISTYFFSV